MVISITDSTKTITKSIASASGTKELIALTTEEVNALADGRIDITVIATDAAGNQSTEESVGFHYRAATPTTPQNITGTVDSEFLWGGTADDSITANAGHDRLIGLDGDDTLNGGWQ